MTASIERLKEIGFELDGHWLLENGKIKLHLSQESKSVNVLYAFVIEGEVLYVGKTTKTLLARMKQYEKPGPRQATNIRKKGFREQWNAKPV